MFGFNMTTIETIKELARHFTLTIEFANSEMRDTGEPVFRVSIPELDIEVEEPLVTAVRMVNEAVNESFGVEDEDAEQVHEPEQESGA